MRKYENDQLENWKTYPVRICGPHLSECHQVPTLLVQSMGGGFVTANCSVCGAKDDVTDAGFDSLELWVSCPKCRKKMSASKFHNNYGYSCDDCELFVRLADLLPHWSDVQ